MQAVYALNLNTLEHVLVCNGVCAKFDISGKYKGAVAAIPANAQQVDCFSILQQGNLCEIAILSGEQYAKRVVGLSKAQNWLKELPFQPKAVFTIKRKVGEEKCIQTIYVFQCGKLMVYAPALLNS